MCWGLRTYKSDYGFIFVEYIGGVRGFDDISKNTLQWFYVVNSGGFRFMSHEHWIYGNGINWTFMRLFIVFNVTYVYVGTSQKGKPVLIAQGVICGD